MAPPPDVASEVISVGASSSAVSPVHGSAVHAEAAASPPPGPTGSLPVGTLDPALAHAESAETGGASESEVTNVELDASQAASGTWVREMRFNSLMQVLAQRMGLQYFFNPSLDSLVVTGNLLQDVPSLQDLQDLGIQYGVTASIKNNTLYAFTPEQLNALPKRDVVYTLKYLRPNANPFTPIVQNQATGADVAVPGLADEGPALGMNFKQLLAPAMSPGGTVFYEYKTNQLVISDNEHSLRRIAEMLEKIDVPKKQVVVDVKILRLTNNADKYFGVDWSGVLGQQGLNIGISAQGPLDQIFASTPVFGNAADLVGAVANIATGQQPTQPTISEAEVTGPGGQSITTTTSTSGPSTTNAPGIILSPLQVNLVLRALIENDLAHEEAGPAVITEDNDPALFRVVERIPIIEQEVTAGTTGVAPTIATNVRYRIDPSDPVDPANSREVGVSIAVTPSSLPDGTIRMRLIPRVATITRFTRVSTGIAGIFNEYPNVNETSVQAIARIPNGYTLVLGGYYQTLTRVSENKVPLLGDIPGLSFAFRSKSNSKIRSNIVFLITPTLYDPSDISTSVAMSEMLRMRSVSKPEDLVPDPEWPGETADPNLLQRLANTWPFRKRERALDQAELSASHEQYGGEARPIQTEQQRKQSRIISDIRTDQ